ncbi:maleylpyruvate isomerase family mycothiol-dependent enzyme [Plantactinospora sp. GCM10030261]|uniref:maleylpyruvate isomerase family mycothiol-dependent enzyme n=1 Tax=Plantactinospora sp. GCM10030261 TaxID=3273420 RepID=UPI003620BA5F
MTRPDLIALAEQERAELADLLRSLDPPQWSTESLCVGWSVRDVAVHVVSYDELPPPALVACFLRGRLRLPRINDIVLRTYDGLDTDRVVDLVARNLRPRGVTSMLGGGIALTDCTIHQQDIRRALGRPRSIPADRLLPALRFALRAPALPAKRNAAGLKLIATDAEWTAGEGPEVAGPLEGLLMATAGRPDALADLTGAGLATLSARVSA